MCESTGKAVSGGVAQLNLMELGRCEEGKDTAYPLRRLQLLSLSVGPQAVLSLKLQHRTAALLEVYHRKYPSKAAEASSTGAGR